MKVRYYTKPGCPLCEKGLVVLSRFPELDVMMIDIEEDAACYARYATRIPVIARERDGRELGWPFDDAAVTALISS